MSSDSPSASAWVARSPRTDAAYSTTAYCIPLQVPRNGISRSRTMLSALRTAASSAYGPPGTSQTPSYAVTSNPESVGTHSVATPRSASIGRSASSSRWLR